MGYKKASLAVAGGDMERLVHFYEARGYRKKASAPPIAPFPFIPMGKAL
jgi:hypothetical protein